MPGLIKKSWKIAILFSGLCISLIFAFSFTLVSNQGDGPAYINYALKLSGEDVSQSYFYRSPLYPLLLAVIVKIFGMESLGRIVIVIQYLLIFCASIILFKTIKLVLTEQQSLISVLLFFFSFSTIYYGYMVLTEILAMLLFLLSIRALMKWIDRKSGYFLLLSGILTSLLILSRFNTLPLIAGFLFIIVYSLIFAERPKSVYSVLVKAFIYLLPLVIVLNIFAFYNYRVNDLYRLFPTGGSPLISRNAILATIDGTEPVSDENETVYNIFLEAANRQKLKVTTEKKASLLQIWKPGFIGKLYSGFQIYASALPALCSLYGINPEAPEPQISENLKPFYKEIISLNRERIFMMRIYSLLNSFRSSSGITMNGNENVNLGLLPAWSIMTYKSAMIFISLFTFVAVLLYLGYRIVTFKIIDPVFLTIIVLYLSFYMINFFFVIAGDSNRYKFPSEPLMFGLFIYFVAKFMRSVASLRSQ